MVVNRASSEVGPRPGAKPPLLWEDSTGLRTMADRAVEPHASKFHRSAVYKGLRTSGGVVALVWQRAPAPVTTTGRKALAELRRRAFLEALGSRASEESRDVARQDGVAFSQGI